MEDHIGYVRSLSDAENVLHHANVSSSAVQKPFQVIYFADKMKPSLLLELDQPLLQAIDSGETVKFIGKSKEQLYLCTKSKTFEIKSAQTSNSLMLVENLKLPQDLENEEFSMTRRNVCGVHHAYLEAKIVKPNVSKIQGLLDKMPYNGPELEPDEYSFETGYFNTNHLIEVVKISQDELMDALNDIDAFQVKGYWRRLSFEYNFRALSYLIKYIDENSWSLSSIPSGETINVLKELLPDCVAKHIFFIYCSATGAVEDDEQIFELNKTKVCRVLASALLSHAEKFNYNDFMDAWRQGVPEGIDVRLEMIRDMAIIDASEPNVYISYFPEHKLSGNINLRFKQLFRAKPIWTYEEIEPFLRKLSTEKQDVKAILTKFTRTSKSDSTVYYSSKYGK